LYYIEYELNSASALTGATGVSAMATSIIADFKDLGLPVKMNENLDVGIKANTTSFTITGVKDAVIACVNNELSAIFNSLSMDKNLSALAIQLLEAEANFDLQGAGVSASSTDLGSVYNVPILDPVGSTGNELYIIRKSSKNRFTVEARLPAAKDVIYVVST